MELLLPKWVVEQMKAEAGQSAEESANAMIDQLIADVLQQSASMVVARVDGDDTAVRQMTAAVFLARACELLKEVRSTDGQLLQILGLRSVLELALVGRYLIEHRKAADEFHRRVAYDSSHRSGLAKRTGNSAAPLPAWMNHLLDGSPGDPRDIASIAGALDKLDGRDRSDRYSASFTYEIAFAFTSETVTHANILGASRYTNADGHMLQLKAAPGPLFSDGPPLLMVSLFVFELALAVYRALEIPTDGLPDLPSRPTSDDD